MTALPMDSLQRERGILPVEGSSGSIMNVEVLEQMLKITQDTTRRLRDDFKIHVVDTSSDELRSDPQRTAEVVADFSLSVIEEQLREDILVVPKSVLDAVFGDKTSLDDSQTEAVMRSFALAQLLC